MRSQKLFVSGGAFIPQFGTNKNDPSVIVSDFWLDSHPVTEAAFRKFLKSHAEWRDEKNASNFSDEKFTSFWLRREPSPNRVYYPAIFVSWFAASAFCEANMGRLPTTFEWEYAARASATKKDGSADGELTAQILDWYAQPNSANALFSVFQGKPNAYGIYHMHGLIWEWTEDFNAFFAATDSRQEGDKNKDLQCGAGSLNGANRENYAAYIRYALRGSLRAKDTLSNLGFRCAYDQKK